MLRQQSEFGELLNLFSLPCLQGVKWQLGSHVDGCSVLICETCQGTFTEVENGLELTIRKTSECRPLGIFQPRTLFHRLHVSLQMCPLSLLMRETNNFIGILGLKGGALSRVLRWPRRCCRFAGPVPAEPVGLRFLAQPPSSSREVAWAQRLFENYYEYFTPSYLVTSYVLLFDGL